MMIEKEGGAGEEEEEDIVLQEYHSEDESKHEKELVLSKSGRSVCEICCTDLIQRMKLKMSMSERSDTYMAMQLSLYINYTYTL